MSRECQWSEQNPGAKLMMSPCNNQKLTANSPLGPEFLFLEDSVFLRLLPPVLVIMGNASQAIWTVICHTPTVNKYDFHHVRSCNLLEYLPSSLWVCLKMICLLIQRFLIVIVPIPTTILGYIKFPHVPL